VSDSSNLAKAEFILKMLDNIETILERHNGIVAALSDEVEARPLFNGMFRLGRP
jgi:3-hydroxymyristoyl/3-hydroxydecanoyl-(acyl carrier protein) dehydratase